MVASYFSVVTTFIAAHPHLAYAVVLLLALSESVPVIGVIVPGTAVILAIGALVPTGVVTLWPLLGAAVAGAILGDGLSFWAGHRYNQKILESWPINRHPGLVTRSEAFFARHGDKSVFIARFLPGVRAFIPLIAGALRMRVSRFYVANVLSALVWAPSHILPAVLVGSAFKQFGAAAEPLAILVILLIMSIWAAIHAVRLSLRYGIPLASAAMRRVRSWAAVRDSHFSRVVLDLLDPSRPDVRFLALLAVVLIGSAWLFFGILEDVVSGDPLVRADTAIYNALQDLRTAPGDAVMIAITELGDTFVVVAVTIAVLLWFAWNRAWRTSIFWLLAIAGASAINTVIKITLHRARPAELFYTNSSAFSFPSGHSTANTVLYGFLAFLIALGSHPAWRLPVAFSATFVALLIAFSRLYLGAHWLSDVTGGLAFGIAWIAVLGFTYLRKPAEPYGAIGLAIVGVTVAGLMGGLNVYWHHSSDTERYAFKPVVQTMTASDWWRNDWQRLPSYRIDMFGEIEEPMTVQWAGNLPAIQQDLLNKGWRMPARWTATNALGWFAAKAGSAELPVVPRLASGRLPSLTLVLPDGKMPEAARFVMRLWASDFELSGASSPNVWIGSVVEEHLDRPISLITISETRPDANAPRNLLLGASRSERLVARTGSAKSTGWDGRILLLDDHSP
ncbi:putative membrane-associated protein [Rhizobium leguminosarum bv. trifolii WSM597]|uniref:Putative membrane-associated protein n=1 Tax=Rhizobium leguminosarum bv. trifolii WSM597 TaxID=754764 RepID=I9N9J6_RHILT|nr:bifunctional DedA family/phosphatase PAP2 family protein [Rhizobium leguminosarum]EJB03372.1 putative membrane-associated protein [Rhizobium leguminosarum bv. trifolii WSM597]